MLSDSSHSNKKQKANTQELSKLTSFKYKDANIAPSKFGSPSYYREQANKTVFEVFLHNRPIDFGSVPLALLCEVFGKFEDDFNLCPSSEFTSWDFRAARELANRMSRLYPDEMSRKAEFNRWFTLFFEVELEKSIGSCISDGHVVVKSNEHRFITVIMEGKGGLSEGAAEPHWQATGYFRAFYKEQQESLRVDHPPALLITYVGKVILRFRPHVLMSFGSVH